MRQCLSILILSYSGISFGMDQQQELVEPPFKSSSSSCLDPYQRSLLRELDEYADPLVKALVADIDNIVKINAEKTNKKTIVADKIMTIICGLREQDDDVEYGKKILIQKVMSKGIDDFRKTNKEDIFTLKQAVLKSKFSYGNKKIITEFLDRCYSGI
jgi:hypothetical protein